MASGGGFLDSEPLIRKIRNGGMLNRTLQSICGIEGLNKNGVKAELQHRIIERIKFYSDRRDTANFDRLKAIVEHPNTISQQSNPYFTTPQSSSSPAAYQKPQHPSSQQAQNGHSVPVAGMGGGNYRSSLNFSFKPSPFYEILEQIGDMKIVDTMAQHRHTISMKVVPSAWPILSRFQNDPSLRVMVFCSPESHGKQDIAFPHQSEIKVNGGEIKANLRGLKNKPGSTRPVDITKDLRLKIPHYTNTVEMTYALTSKASAPPPASTKFYLVMFVVKTMPVEKLVRELESGKRITKDSVIRDMVHKSRDADIVTTASVLSLKCPLSTLRLDLPCRSLSCKHNQCFDATSFLQLQEQGPTWICPICNNAAPFESLAVDEYVRNILKSTSRSVDQVSIEPDGEWKLYTKPETSSKSNGVSSDFDDEDLVEVTPAGNRATSSLKTPSAEYTPSSASGSAGPRNGSTSGKRTISAVIDLTSSGDEDDEPAPKRQQINGNGYGTPSNVPALAYRGPAYNNRYN